MTEDGERLNEGLLRAFVAIGLSETLRDRLANYVARLRRTGGRVSWPPPENLHITLIFLGDISVAAVPRAAQVLDKVAAATAPFEVKCEGVGTFGSPRAFRVIWAGVSDPDGRLTRLQAEISSGLETEGFRFEKRPFHAHITLGRVRSPAGLRGLTSLLASDNNTLFGEVSVREILLMRSHLRAEGPKYEKVHVSELKGATDL